MLIKELTLLTNNLSATQAFYTGIIGFPLLEQTKSAISFLTGHTILRFLLSNDHKPYYHFAFSIPPDKLDEAHAFMAERSEILPFDEAGTIADFSNWNARAFYFHDNQNNIVEFIAHNDLPGRSNIPFDKSSVLGVCEIGVPSADVIEACEKINTEYNVTYFIKGPRLQDFSVMGDYNGMFIVTRIGRGWLPTQQAARRFYIRIAFENNDSTGELIIC